jgi:hypothetical protein
VAGRSRNRWCSSHDRRTHGRQKGLFSLANRRNQIYIYFSDEDADIYELRSHLGRLIIMDDPRSTRCGATLMAAFSVSSKGRKKESSITVPVLRRRHATPRSVRICSHTNSSRAAGAVWVRSRARRRAHRRIDLVMHKERMKVESPIHVQFFTHLARSGEVVL